MSSYDKAMPDTASSLVSRRLFTKRAIGTIAATAGIFSIAQASATELGPTHDEPQIPQQERVVSDETTSDGQFIVDFAMQYLGYPYVYGGNGPGGFDCSGFTQYVLLNTLGINIGHASGGQYGTGAWVDAGDLLPGDEVFFANTYGSGVSHTGIYIGDGQFIHAENEGTGVCISWLWNDYYSSHYCGANRHW
ncbi:MAG: C40 family peptidase [Thermomicrobiales bacterium]|nr:C40 family peptidase [Thermomicrobiales bacterium]